MLQAGCTNSFSARKGKQLNIKSCAAIMVNINGIKGLSTVNTIVKQ